MILPDTVVFAQRFGKQAIDYSGVPNLRQTASQVKLTFFLSCMEAAVAFCLATLLRAKPAEHQAS